MSSTRTRHDPGCKILSHPDLDCDEADLLGVDQVRYATLECRLAPSRTQPFHAFDDTDWDGECVYGCGTTRDRVQDDDADV